MRHTLLAAAASLAAAIGPAAAQEQAFPLKTWTCTATTGDVAIYRIGPGEFRGWNRIDKVFGANLCEQPEACLEFQGQLHINDSVAGVRILFQAADRSFLFAAPEGGSLTGTCEVTD